MKHITTLWVDSLAMRRFKRRARLAYPNEIYGILLGIKCNKFTFDVHDIIIPPLKESTCNYVIPDYAVIDKIVEESRFTYIGQIHTHPNAAPTLSKHDAKTWDEMDVVVGILSIRKPVTEGGRFVMELKVWRKDSSCPVEVKYF